MAGRSKYTEAQKLEAVRMLRDHNYNYRYVTKVMGVAYQTLIGWKEKYNSEFDSTPVRRAALESELDIGEIKLKFFRENYGKLNDLLGVAIDKAKDIISKGALLEDINDTIKIITECANKMNAAAGAATEVKRPQVNFIQASIQALNQYNKEREEDK